MSYTNDQIKDMIKYKEKELSNFFAEKDLLLDKLRIKEDEFATCQNELQDLKSALDILEKYK